MPRPDKKPFRKPGSFSKGRFGGGRPPGRDGFRRDADSGDGSRSAGERLQKVMSAAGIGSRRHCEDLIAAGRVDVDGKTARLGDRVDPATQQIRIDGEALRAPRRPAYYLVNKPDGVVSTNYDQAGRTRVIDLVPQHEGEHLFTVGRLDLSSEGLILVTNDGELANWLTHPRYGVEKTYLALVAGQPAPEVYDELRRGVHLAEGLARCAAVHVRKSLPQSTLLEIVLNEGKNREIRRILAKVGHKVLTLKRIAIGNVKLRELRPGEHRRATPAEVDALREAAFRGNRPERQPFERAESQEGPPIVEAGSDEQAGAAGPGADATTAPGGESRPRFERKRFERSRPPQRAENRPRGNRRPPDEAGGEGFSRKPPFAKRPFEGRRPFGKRPPQGQAEGSTEGRRPPSGKPRFGDRPPFGDRSKSGKPPFGTTPFGKSRFGEQGKRPYSKKRPPYGEAAAGAGTAGPDASAPETTGGPPPFRRGKRPQGSGGRPPFARDGKPPFRKRPDADAGERPPFLPRAAGPDGPPSQKKPFKKPFKKRRAKPLFPNRKKRGDGPPPTGRTIIGDDD